MIIEGTIQCEKCGNKIDWFYMISQKGSVVYAEPIPINKSEASRVRRINNKKNEIKCRCKKCDRLNFFDYETEYRL